MCSNTHPHDFCSLAEGSPYPLQLGFFDVQGELGCLRHALRH